MTKFFLIHVMNDGRGGGDDPKVIGPMQTASDQIDVARSLRPTLSDYENLLWLDIEYIDSPIVGAFDPQFWEGKE